MNKGIFQIMIYVIPSLLILYVLHKILQSVGIVETKKSKEEKNKTIKVINSDYFNPNYYKTVLHKFLDLEVSKRYAHDLRVAFSGFGTDEGAVYSTFKKLDNKVQISEISSSYYIQYKRDLKADLLDELNESEVAIVYDIINSLKDV